MMHLQSLAASWTNGTRLAIPDVTFHSGERVAVLGTNGSGKTTLLRSLAGLDNTLQQHTYIQGRALADLSLIERAQRLSFLPAETTVNYPFSVSDIVSWGRFPFHQGQPSPDDNAIAQAWISRFQLAPLAQKSVLALSSGERQRAFLARLFSAETLITLLDEPFARLDAKQSKLFSEILRGPELAQRLCLIIHHDLWTIRTWATRAILLHEGQWLECPLQTDEALWHFLKTHFEM